MRRILLALPAIAFAFPLVAGAQKWTAVDAARATQHYRTGWERMQKEAWAEAAREFQEAVTIDPKFALAYYALGRAQGSQHKYAEAIRTYLKCREVYLARAGEQFSNQLDKNKALDDQLFELNDYMGKVFKGSADERRRLELQMQRMREAKQQNQSLTIEISVPYFVPLALGSAYFRSERFEEAEREYKTALDANPKSGETHNNLAVLYMLTARLGDAQEEIVLAEKAGYKVSPNLKDELKQKMGK